jgi:hypothetical protein
MLMLIPLALVAACGSTTPPASAPPPAVAATATQAATPTGPASEICQFADNGGSYYLLVTSATDHNFKACAGGTLYKGTIDDLFNTVPGLDRRCILGTAATVEFDALVAAYSDTKKADLAAARAFCAANGGTENG